MKSKVDTIEEAQHLTAMSLAKMIQTTEELTRLQLQDVTELAEEVSRVVPAGNVVTMVLSQLSSIKGRRVSDQETRRMLSLLNKGMATFLDRAAYLTFFTTPALLIGGYQLLLKAAGKNPDDAFPNGTWQFYLEFGLREDSGRHACETVGFQQKLVEEKLQLSDGDVLASWIIAASWLLMSYDALVGQEWNERRLLRELTQKLNDDHVAKVWLARRPYGVPITSDEDYVAFRQRTFFEFIRDMLATKYRQTQVERTANAWTFGDETLVAEARRAYQEQMSILATLNPEEFNDLRIPLDLNECYVGVIYKGTYYAIPVFHRQMPLDYMTIRALAQGIISSTVVNRKQKNNLDQLLVNIPRQNQAEVRSQLPPTTLAELERLRRVPVVLNWDTETVDVLSSKKVAPLADIRREGRRAIGDHALTIFRTKDSFVFDQSHIFFDATWGMAISEIMTNQAVRYARALDNQPPIDAPGLRPSIIDLSFPPELPNRIKRFVDETYEISAETSTSIVAEINELRRLLKKRNEDIQITVNDFLVLYRSLFNQYYKPSRKVLDALEGLRRRDVEGAKAADDIQAMLKELSATLPAFLIPMDASAINPSDRIFPVTFRPQPPWTDIANEHESTWSLLLECQTNSIGRQGRDAWNSFYEARNRYLEMLRMFGVLMLKYKEVALSGKSFSTATLRILASVPKRLQPMFRNIPDRIDILNDMLKGTEVFSNAGKVAETSSLTRFITAKDDNRKKTLCWGIMTRADDEMVISLRDFRPQLSVLVKQNAYDVAKLITEDFLEGYAAGLEGYIRELTEIVKSSRR